MTREALKLALVEVFIENRANRPPTIDDAFIALYKDAFFAQLINSCASQLASSYGHFGINSYFVATPFEERYRNYVYRIMYPHTLEWLKEYSIPYKLDGGGDEPMIVIQIKDLEEFSNVENLGALA